MFVFIKDVKKSILIVFFVLFSNSFFLSCSEEGFLEKFFLENFAEYVVAFNSVGGSSVESQTLKEGSRVTKPVDPGKTGYKFLAWTNSDGEEYNFSSTAVTNDFILGAKWIRFYTATFNSVGGLPVKSQTQEGGVFKVTKPADPTRSDYDFLAWTNSAGEEYDFSADVTGDIVLGAQWIRTYKVNFYFLNGDGVQSTNIRESSNVIRPADPSRQHYFFSNWYTNNEGTGTVYDFNVAVSNDIDFYAKWNRDSSKTSFTLTVKYNDGGAAPDKVIIVPIDDTVSAHNLPIPQHPNPAYDFYGWYTTAMAEEGDEYDTNQVIRSDTTIYAKWLADNLEKIVHLKRIPEDLSEYDQLTRNVLSPYKVGAEIDALYVDQGKTGGGVTWADANQDIADVIMDSTADASEDKVYLVLVTGETHFPDRRIEISGRHVAVIGGYHRDGNWSRPADHRTVLDGSYGRRLFYFNNNLERNTLLYDIEIFQGRGGPSAYGHGIIVDNASPILWKVVFRENNLDISGYGGGMSINTVSSSSEFSYPVLIDVKFINNQAYHGGALYVLNSSVILSNVEFSYNKSDSVTDGRGPMYVRIDRTGEYPDMILDGISFRSNQGVQGGALAFVIANNVSPDILPITLKDVEFEYNTAKTLSGLGGALFLKAAADVLLKNVTFANNEAGDNGGAVYSDASSSVFINTTFYKNKAKRGSVILMDNTLGDHGYAPDSRFINVTASDNDSTEGSLHNGDIYIADGAYHIPSREGSKTWLLNSIFYDTTFQVNKPLVYINNQSSADYTKHKLYLLYSTIDGKFDTLNNSLDSAAAKIRSQKGVVGDNFKIQYFNKGSVAESPGLGSLMDNGGRIKTMSVDPRPEMDDGGIYVQWRKDMFRFYYSENNSDWYTDIRNNKFSAPIISFPVEAEELTGTDARGFDRVGRPGLGAFENQ